VTTSGDSVGGGATTTTIFVIFEYQKLIFDSCFTRRLTSAFAAVDWQRP
jgi:hypothetical protein